LRVHLLHAVCLCKPRHHAGLERVLLRFELQRALRLQIQVG